MKRKRRGNVFKCQNPECRKISCLLCNRESKPFHKCYEREQDSLRLFVEKAMADAVKRTVSIKMKCEAFVISFSLYFLFLNFSAQNVIYLSQKLMDAIK